MCIPGYANALYYGGGGIEYRKKIVRSISACSAHFYQVESLLFLRSPSDKNAFPSYQKKARKITPGSTCLRIIRNSMGLPEAKTWVNCRPSTGYQTNIPNHHFKNSLQHFCQVPLFQPGARCPRPPYAAVLDTFGDHLLYYERGSHRIRRHDA